MCACFFRDTHFIHHSRYTVGDRPSSSLLQTVIKQMSTQLNSACVAQYLADNPEFFLEHPTLLTQIKLSSPRADQANRAVSLQERQMEVLREKYKTLESHMANLMRIGQENDVMTYKYQHWTRSLLLARNDVDCINVLIHGLQKLFDVPYATLRLWQTTTEHADTWFTQPVSDEAKDFANSLSTPYCGITHHAEFVNWLDKNTSEVQSTVLLPLRLRAESHTHAFGLLVLGSPDPQRYTADMATDFLNNISETASAALAGFITT